jgi:group I intron endonuclease
MIVNKVNGKTYVGQHKSNSWQDKYMGSGTYLSHAKRKYGIKNFEKFLIQYCNSKEDADKAEIFWIAEYRKRGKAEYNIAKGGEGGCGLHSEKTRRKISEANKGKHGHTCSEEHKRKISEAQKGRTLSEETRRKLSKALKGRSFSEETRKKLSEAKKEKHWKLVDGKRVWY